MMRFLIIRDEINAFNCFRAIEADALMLRLRKFTIIVIG